MIPAGKRIGSICIRTEYDYIFENNESFIVIANIPSNNIIDSTDCRTTVTITEDGEFIYFSLCKAVGMCHSSDSYLLVP